MKKLRSALLDSGRLHAGRRLTPNRPVRSRPKKEIVITGTRAQDVGGIQVPDTTKAKAVITKELIDRQQSGPDHPQRHQPGPERQLHQLGPLRQLGRQHPHPRLRRQPHQPDLRRRSAQRQRQLRDLLEPAARSGADRAGQRRPRRHRRQLADRVGRRRHHQLSYDHADQRRWACACRARSATGTTAACSACSTPANSTPWGTKAWISASHAENDKFKGPGEINK